MATEFHNLQEMRHSASLVTKVFIQRDYSEGTVCRFQTKFPSELDNRIERTLLEETVKTLNSYYVEAEKIGGQSYLEGCLACATAYIIFLCMETRYEKMLRKITGYIQEQNEKIYAPRGLLLTDPVERGMRVLAENVSRRHIRDLDQTGFKERLHIRHTQEGERGDFDSFSEEMSSSSAPWFQPCHTLEISVFEDRASGSSSPSSVSSAGSGAR